MKQCLNSSKEYFIVPFYKDGHEGARKHLTMSGSYVAFNLLPSDPFDLLASCIVSLTQRINKYVYVCMYVPLFRMRKCYYK